MTSQTPQWKNSRILRLEKAMKELLDYQHVLDSGYAVDADKHNRALRRAGKLIEWKAPTDFKIHR